LKLDDKFLTSDETTRASPSPVAVLGIISGG
jgi:hypothetical protein